MIYKVTYIPTGDTLYAASEFEAFCALDSIAYLRNLDFHALDKDFWLILHDFPEDVSAVYHDFSISSDSGKSLPSRDLRDYDDFKFCV